MIEFQELVKKESQKIAEIHLSSKKAGEKGISPDTYLNALLLDDYVIKWQKWLDQGIKGLMALHDGQPAGIISFGNVRTRPAGDQGIIPLYSAEVFSLYVLPAFWGKGIGRALMLRAALTLQEQRHNGVVLWVLKDNKKAVDFYLALGGQRIGKQKADFGGRMLTESAIGWRNLAVLVEKAKK